MKISDVLTGILLAIFGMAIVLFSQTFPPIHGQDFGPRAFPTIIGSAFIVCAIFLVRKGLRAHPRAPWLRLSDELRHPRSMFRFMLVPLVLVLYILFSDSVGFLLFSMLFLLVLFLAFEVAPLKAMIMAVVGGLVVFYAFYSLLHVPLPWGILERFAW